MALGLFFKKKLFFNVLVSRRDRPVMKRTKWILLFYLETYEIIQTRSIDVP